MNQQYKNLTKKTCLVTGGTGFIGSHLCAQLSELGAAVISVDIEGNKEGTYFKLLNGHRDIQTKIMDLSDSSSIKKIAKLKPDFLFHLSGLPYAPFTSIHPVSSFRSNVSTTANMLEAARVTSAERFVLASSACVFGATIDSPIPINGNRSRPEHYYSYTKRQAESQAESYNEFYDVPISICRFVNIYGPGDRHFGRLIPALCRQLIELTTNELTLFRSSGESVFEFLYVEDAVSGLLAAAIGEDSTFGIYHFGPGPMGRMKIIDIANKLSILYDNRKRKLNAKATDGERTVQKYLDFEETVANIGWKPRWDLNTGLSSTVDWYRENITKIKPFNYSLHSI